MNTIFSSGKTTITRKTTREKNATVVHGPFSAIRFFDPPAPEVVINNSFISTSDPRRVVTQALAGYVEEEASLWRELDAFLSHVNGLCDRQEATIKLAKELNIPLGRELFCQKKAPG
jgi:hypothetical protein